MGNLLNAKSGISALPQKRYLPQLHTENLELIFRFFYSRSNTINDYTLCILFRLKLSIF